MYFNLKPNQIAILLLSALENKAGQECRPSGKVISPVASLLILEDEITNIILLLFD
jgi:hypothetical protein